MSGRAESLAGTDALTCRRHGRAALAWFWICLAVLLQFHIRQTLTTSVLYDDAFIASVAKNVALGYGYSSSYHTVDLYDPEISTGPAIVLPAALLIRALGNRFWVPGLAFTIAMWTSLGLLLWRLRRDYPELSRAAPGIVLITGLVFFGTNEFGLLGDLPAALLAGASFVLFAAGAPGNRARSVAAGIVFGIAVYAKLTVALALPAIIIVPLIHARLGRRDASRPAALRQISWFVAGLLLPAFAWQVCQLTALSGDVAAWIEVKRREWAFLTGSQSLSGVGQLRTASSFREAAAANAARSLAALSAYSGGVARLLPAGLGMLAAMTMRGHSARTAKLMGMLACATVLHLAWWMVISPTGWYRHLLPGIVYALTFAAVAVGSAAVRAPRKALVAAIGCGITIALVLPAWYPKAGDFARVFRLDFRRDPRLTALLEARDEVERLSRDPSVLLMGCGWWVARDLEYVLPRVNNFRDCFRLNPDDAAAKRLLLVRNEIFNQDKHEPLVRYRARCEQRVLYARDPFVIAECPGLPRPDSRP